MLLEGEGKVWYFFNTSYYFPLVAVQYDKAGQEVNSHR